MFKRVCICYSHWAPLILGWEKLTCLNILNRARLAPLTYLHNERSQAMKIWFQESSYKCHQRRVNANRRSTVYFSKHAVYQHHSNKVTECSDATLKAPPSRKNIKELQLQIEVKPLPKFQYKTENSIAYVRSSQNSLTEALLYMDSLPVFRRFNLRIFPLVQV